MIRPAAGLVALALAVGVSSCGSDGETSDHEVVVGVVTAVQGDLRGIEEFEVLLSDGTTLVVTPVPGLSFDGGPLAHVQDHLRTGAPVRLSIDRDGSSAVAYEIGDD